MVYLLCILLGAGCIAFWRYVAKTRRLVRELEEAVLVRRRFLLEGDSAFSGLVGAVNALVVSSARAAEVNESGGDRVEAMLGSIQEVVIVLDQDHGVVFANEAARGLFQMQGTAEVRGARLESVLRSVSLLDFLAAYQAGTEVVLGEVSIESGGELLWFEASCAAVLGADAETTLLVLHDVTRLKGLELMQREFVANVSHELRTPLTVVRGFAETLLEDHESLPVAMRARFLGKIVNHAERLHVLVEDLLTLSRLESKAEVLSLEVQSLRVLFEESVEACRPRLNVETQQIVLDFDDRVGDFAFDRFQIQQVVDNLLENVFRYAPEFQCLRVAAVYCEGSGEVACSISDDGPGIAAKDLPHIFDRFYCVDLGRSRERGGTGLGLSILKQIVEQHGGHVSVESELGQGTTMRFSLPYVQSPESNEMGSA